MNDFAPLFKTPGIEFWPEFRWWLAEGFHTDSTLKKDMEMIYNSGFGAVEILSLDDAGVDSSLYGWGSEEWMHDQSLLLDEATSRNMGFSMTSGANWSNANLVSIAPDDVAASKELDYVSVTVHAGKTWAGVLPRAEIKMPHIHQQILIAVVSGKRIGEKDGSILLDKDSLTDLTAQVANDELTWTAPGDGEYELFFFWMHGTGQIAEPAARTSYTINYIDKYGVDAWIDYWDKQMLSPQAKATIRKNGRVQIYMDSLELSTYGKAGQFWGYHVLEEFESRRGYDLTRYLPLIIKQTTISNPKDFYTYVVEDDIFSSKLYNDLYQTMTDLYIYNTLVPLNNWLHNLNMGIRAEISYCMPFEISQPGFAVDGIETESLEFASQIDCYRGMSGSAHIYNKLFSSETGCSTMNYKRGLNFYDQIIYTQFAAGVARTVLHGYSSIAGSESATQWPGHEGMMKVFSERFGCRQPSFEFYKEWSGMIARFQYILRQGNPRMDLGILRLDYRFDPTKFSLDEEISYDKMWMRANEGIYWKDTTLQNNGYTYDYFAPQLLDAVDFTNGEIAPEGPGYQALIIYQEAFPCESAKRILSWALKGLPVVFVNGVTEQIQTEINVTHQKAACRTPFNDEKDTALAEIIAQIKACKNVREIDDPAKAMETLQELGVYPRIQMSRPTAKLLPFLRENGDKNYVYLYNCMYQDTEPETISIKVKGTGKPYALDCWSGEISEVPVYQQKNKRTIFEVTVAPGEALLFALDSSAEPEKHAVESNACDLRKSGCKTIANFCESGRYTTIFSDNSTATVTVEVPDNIQLTNWQLKVEDWNEGEKKITEENRGRGYVTREVWYETDKRFLTVENTELKPWKDIPEIGSEVAGIGHYSTTFQLPLNWGESNGAVLKINGSTNGNPVFVTINGMRSKPVNSKTLSVDVSELLQPGENTIQIDVPTPLNNRMKARGYYTAIISETIDAYRLLHPDRTANLPDTDSILAMPEEEQKQLIFSTLGHMAPLIQYGSRAIYQDNGIVGNVQLITYVHHDFL